MKKHTLFLCAGAALLALAAAALALWPRSRAPEAPAAGLESLGAVCVAASELPGGEKDGFGGLTALSFQEGSLLYFSGATVYRHDFASGETASLGEIENYVLHAQEPSLARLDGQLYFCVTAHDAEGQAVGTMLRIDLAAGRLAACLTSEPGAPVALDCYTLGERVIRKRDAPQADGSIDTYLELYDPATGETSAHHTQHWRSYEEEGSAFYDIYADGSSLYALLDEYDAQGTLTRKLLRYDEALTLQQSLVLDGAAADFLGSGNGRLRLLRVCGNLLFLADNSSYGFLGRIRDGAVEPLLDTTHYLAAACGSAEGWPEGSVFLLRSSNELYFCDPDSGALQSVQLPLEQGETLRSVYLDGAAVLLVTQTLDEAGERLPDRFYTLPLTQLLALAQELPQ